MWNASATGCIVPTPTMYGGCFMGSSGAIPTPEATGSLTMPKTCGTLVSRLAPASTCRLGVDSVTIRSYPPETSSRAIVFEVAASPSELNRRSRIVSPSE